MQVDMTEKKRVVVIGGGTGTHTVLRGLKQYHKQLDLAAVVSMADSGGSTGRLRDEFGFLPVGDVRMALTALASDIDQYEELVRELFLYRFDRGDGLSGHNFGNLLLVALTDILGNEEAAIRAAGEVLRVRGKVVPVTTEEVDLVAAYDDGVAVIGEHHIDEPSAARSTKKIVDLAVTPAVGVNPRAREAILEADLIVLGPGDLYTSVLANCVVEGVAEAIRHSRATVVYVCNLMTKLGQTTDMSVEDHAAEITRYIHQKPDYVLVNNGKIASDLLARYVEDEEFPVQFTGAEQDPSIIIDDFLAKEAITTHRGDVLKRSLVRHDSQRLARTLFSLLH